MKTDIDITKVLEYDLKHFANIQTNGICNCDKYCESEGVCRAFSITEIDIKSVNMIGISEFIWNKSNSVSSKQYKRNEKIKSIFDGYDSKVEIYCLERILTINKLYDTQNWEFSYINGYYGHEVDKLTIHHDVIDNIKEQIQKLMLINSFKGKVEYILELEYGFVLDQLKDRQYKIEMVDKKNIYFPQKKHYEKVKNRTFYKTRPSSAIMGICIKDGCRYRVIDGYNRISQTNLQNIFIISTDE